VNDLRFVNNFAERKLERTCEVLNLQDKKTKAESGTFLVGGVMLGLLDIFPIIKQINEFIIAEERFSGEDVWQYAPKKEKELLIGRAKDLKNALERIEKKAKQ
jgi:hypothetical protein